MWLIPASWMIYSQRSDMPTQAYEGMSFDDLFQEPLPKCVACEGSGQLSSGLECVPCKGTGHRIPNAIVYNEAYEHGLCRPQQ